MHYIVHLLQIFQIYQILQKWTLEIIYFKDRGSKNSKEKFVVLLLRRFNII